MSLIEDAKKKLNDVSVTKNKLTSKLSAGKFNRKIWYEILAYTIQAAAIIVPISVITTLNNSWTKTGLGFGIMVSLFALFIVFYKPIKKLSKSAPGLLPFVFIFLFALFMYTTMQTILIVSACGMAGSVAAMPLHIVYESSKRKEDTPEVLALKEIAAKLTKIDED